MQRVGKSKSFQMRRSNSNVNSKRRRDHSMDRSRVVRSYDELIHNPQQVLPLVDNDSDSDCDKGEPDDSSESRYYEQWVSSIGLPNLLLWTSPPTTSSASTSTTSKLTFQTPVRTRSKFKPAYLLQKRKEALAQHPLPFLMIRESHSRRHSLWALLFLLGACYLLCNLASGGAAVGSAQQPVKPTYYYLNLKETRPLQIVTKMLSLHAHAYQQGQDQNKPTKFAGVCGYPTNQQSSQREAINWLVQMGLQDLLQFDVCPPIEAVLQRDSHYVVWEEADLMATIVTQKVELLTDPGWQAALAVQAKPTTRDPSDLWSQVLAEGQQQQQQQQVQLRRRLEGLN